MCKYYLDNRLRYFREKAGLTQRELALKVGCSKNTISSIERLEFSPSSFLAAKLCIVLDVKFEDLFFLVQVEEM